MGDVVIRNAEKRDANLIAELFRLSSDGVADYIWDGLRDDYPGLELLEIGARRYGREGVDFSYEKCLMADVSGKPVGMAHAYVMEADEGPLPDDFDPVLRPYAELELPGSYYVSGLALITGQRNRGIGSHLLNAVDARARDLGCSHLSLIVFEQNEGARRLYDRLGFAEVDRRAVVPHPMIHHTGDALLMARAVS